MPDEENKTVNIDTSGPDVDIEIENQQPDNEVTNETTNENNNESNDSPKKPDEQLDIQVSETEIETTKEEPKKKELDDYSDGVKRRIAKLTKKMRDAERREHAATEYAKNVLAEKEKLTSRLTTLDTGYVSEMENRINSSMEAAAAKLTKAREDGDIQAEINATKEISKLGYEEARLAEIKAKSAKKPVETEIRQPVATPQQTSQPINPDPKAQQWASKNSWFGADEAMTYTAFGLHQKLTEEEGYDAQSEEYYVEIDKRIRLEFPHKFGNTNANTTIPTQNVASATRSKAGAGRKVVRLTPSQVAISKRLGVPLQEYAKQLNITKEV